MDIKQLEQLIESYKREALDTHQVAQAIQNLFYEDVGYARVDHARADRQGFPEVVFGKGKTREQVVGIVERLLARSA